MPRPVTVSVSRDSILHMGLPWSVAVDGGVTARFAEKIRAVGFAYELHEELGGSVMGVELSIEPRDGADEARARRNTFDEKGEPYR